MTTNLNDNLSEHFYLAGPMSGIEDHNFPAFRTYTKALRNIGYKVVSPQEITEADPMPPGTYEWEHYLKEDLAFVIRCRGLILMPGWKHSRGARVELYVADILKLEIYHINSDMVVTRDLNYGSKVQSENLS